MIIGSLDYFGRYIMISNLDPWDQYFHFSQEIIRPLFKEVLFRICPYFRMIYTLLYVDDISYLITKRRWLVKTEQLQDFVRWGCSLPKIIHQQEGPVNRDGEGGAEEGGHAWWTWWTPPYVSWWGSWPWLISLPPVLLTSTQGVQSTSSKFS